MPPSTTPPTEAIARVSEFLRQWNLPNSHRTDEIAGLHIDPAAKMAYLRAQDLAALLAALGGNR